MFLLLGSMEAWKRVVLMHVVVIRSGLRARWIGARVNPGGNVLGELHQGLLSSVFSHNHAGSNSRIGCAVGT